MTSLLTSNGQVTIHKKMRDALELASGKGVEFDVDECGCTVSKAGQAQGAGVPDRFQRARGRATTKWGTDELMQLLRGDDQG